MNKVIPSILTAVAITTIGLTAITPPNAFGDEYRNGPSQDHRDRNPGDRDQKDRDQKDRDQRDRDQPHRDRSKQEHQYQHQERKDYRQQPYQAPPQQRREYPGAPPQPRQPPAPPRPTMSSPERHMDRDDRRTPELRRETHRHEYEWRDNHYRPIRPNPAPILRLPPDHHSLHHNGKRYYEYGGRYYIDGPSGFILVGAPIGAVIANLPIGYLSIRIGGIPYFYANGIYYRHYHTSGYVIVTAPYPAYTPMDQRVVVQAQALNMRSGPGMDYSVISVLYRGEVLSVLGSTDGWYYVQRDNGEVGWIVSTYTSPDYNTPRG